MSDAEPPKESPPLKELIAQLPDATVAKKRRKDFQDMTGKVFGSWTVLAKVERKHYWKCRCACGVEKDVFAPDLRRGASTSCGCVPYTPEEIAERTAKAVATRAERTARRKAKEAKREAARLEREKIKAAETAKAEAQRKEAEAAAERKKTGRNIKYGIDFGDHPSVNPLSIELQCYRERLNTGKPREFHFRNAFNMVWPKFQWNEWCEMMMYAWCNFRVICVIGHTRASKSYFFSYLVLLDYLGGAPMTASTLTTTKFDALKTRMWGDMMRAIEAVENPVIQSSIQNAFKITNTSNEMKFASATASHGDDKFMIQGVATDSADKTAGKIRGQHADRRRIIGDEAQDIAPAIYKAIANAISAPDFVCGLLSNPVEKLSEFGKWCEPIGGWSSIHDTDLSWLTKTPGGICLHFDGLQSPNIKAGKTVFPYLLDQAYIDFIRTQYGESSLEWWMYVRGFFPPDGTVSRVWPSHTIEKAKSKVEFDYIPEAWASLDPAYEYDDPVLTLAIKGRMRDSRPCCMATKQHRIKLNQSDSMTKDRQLANETMRLCKEAGVLPENFICDTTGNGRSVYALLFESWSHKINKLEYGGAATDRPLRLNDAKPANEQVKYFVAELWFRASYLAADGLLCGFTNLDPKCEDDLTARRYTIKQDGERKVMVVETKDEMKKRLGRSPDYGDSLCQLGELMVRKGLLGEVSAAASPARAWTNLRQLAKKAASRFSEKKEFSYRG